jgi:transcriptional regulator with XRE-family HTH domain
MEEGPMSTGQCVKWPIVALDSGVVAISGEQIKRERRRRNLTQQQLAAEAGVSLRTIGRVERGELQESRNFEAITAVLGLQTNSEAPVGKLLADASMADVLQRVQELYDDAVRRATEAGRIYKPGAPELDEVGLLAGPTGRTERASRAGRIKPGGGPTGG